MCGTYRGCIVGCGVGEEENVTNASSTTTGAVRAFSADLAIRQGHIATIATISAVVTIATYRDKRTGVGCLPRLSGIIVATTATATAIGSKYASRLKLECGGFDSDEAAAASSASSGAIVESGTSTCATSMNQCLAGECQGVSRAQEDSAATSTSLAKVRAGAAAEPAASTWAATSKTGVCREPGASSGTVAVVAITTDAAGASETTTATSSSSATVGSASAGREARRGVCARTGPATERRADVDAAGDLNGRPGDDHERP
jgi:hypothetical protein